MRFRRICQTVVFSLAVAFISVSPAAAQQPANPPPPQDSGGGGIGFGVEIGVTKPTFTGQEGLDLMEGRNGLMGGIWFGGNRNGTLGFLGELVYGVKKAHVLGVDLEQHYLEIPAVFRINVGSKNRERFVAYGLVGPVVDIKLSSKLEGIDVADEYEGFDLGILGGAGVELSRIGIEVRGNWGQRRFFDPAEGGDDIKTFTLQIVGKIRIN